MGVIGEVGECARRAATFCNTLHLVAFREARKVVCASRLTPSSRLQAAVQDDAMTVPASYASVPARSSLARVSRGVCVFTAWGLTTGCASEGPQRFRIS